MIAAVKKTIATYFPHIRGQRILVAVSGGADSTALALALQTIGCRIALAHVHHGLRGKAADADARFVAALARKLRVPFFLGKFNVPAEAKKTGESLEMAARRLRRQFLRATARHEKFRYVATGHTADDQAETLLLRICRGTSITGLAGIPHLKEFDGVKFIRPLRDVPRRDIVAFLQHHRQPWREDKTNRADFSLRNRVRHEILPLLEKRLNPAVRQALLRLGQIAAAEDEVMAALAKKSRPVASAPLALRRRLALATFQQAGLPPEKQIFHSVENFFPQHGKNCPAPSAPAKEFSIAWKNPARFSTAWKIPPVRNLAAKKTLGPAGYKRERLRWPDGRTLEIRAGRGFSRRQDEVCLSAAAVDGRDLIFRGWRAGDRMQPLGMTGTKKLSDIFTDLKIPREDRGSWIVVECGGRIAALAGWRVSRDFAVEAPRAPSIRIRILPPPRGSRVHKARIH